MSRSRGGPEPQIRASRRLIQVAEWEYQQILLDIHDGPVQHMYAALSQLDLARRAVRPGVEKFDYVCGEVESRLERVRMLLETGLNDIRTFIGAYRTPEFEGRGVGELLEGLALQHEALTDARVTIRAEEWPEGAPLPVKIVLYRVLQEALSNAYRHGGASDVAVELERQGEQATPWLRLTVRDNGAGFDRSHLPPGKHFGLRGMEARVTMIGGRFTLESAVRAGTTVRAEVPLW